jgi:hypothetical protein
VSAGPWRRRLPVVTSIALVAVGALLAVLGAVPEGPSPTAAVPDPAGAAAAPGATTERDGERPRERGRGAVLGLASQTPWVAPDGEFQLRLSVDPTVVTPDLEVVVAVHGEVASRGRLRFQATLEDRLLGPALPGATTRAPLTELTRDATGAVIVRLGVQSQPGDPDRIVLRQSGVYPVRVELQRAGDPVAGFTTHLVRTSAGDFPPLAVAWVQPVDAPGAVQPDGSFAVDAGGLGDLGDLVDALSESPPGLPLVLAPEPALLDALAVAGEDDLLDGLRALAAGRQLLTGPYADVDLATLLRAGLLDEVASHLELGAGTIAAVLGVARPDGRTWLADDHLDAQGVSALSRLGIDRLAIPDAALSPVDLQVTLTRPFQVEGRLGRGLEAVVLDAGLQRHFTGDDDPVLRAHHLLADMAMLYFDQPGMRRGVVVAAPRDWEVSPTFLRAALAGLQGPVLRPVSLDELFEEIEPAAGEDGSLVRRLEPREAPRLGINPAEVTRARAALTGFGSMLEPDNPMPAALERQLLMATAAGLTAPERAAYLRGVTEAIQVEVDHIQVPDERTFTLSAREGTIPVTLRNRAGYPVRVTIHLESDKLEFRGRGRAAEVAAVGSDGEPVAAETAGERSRVLVIPDLLLDEVNTTIELDVLARGPGTFNVRAVVTSPDRWLEVSESRLTVRSTAASGVGVVLSAGAALFLVVWWGSHFRTVRRDRRLVQAT